MYAHLWYICSCVYENTYLQRPKKVVRYPALSLPALLLGKSSSLKLELYWGTASPSSWPVSAPTTLGLNIGMHGHTQLFMWVLRVWALLPVLVQAPLPTQPLRLCPLIPSADYLVCIGTWQDTAYESQSAQFPDGGKHVFLCLNLSLPSLFHKRPGDLFRALPLTMLT